MKKLTIAPKKLTLDKSTIQNLGVRSGVQTGMFTTTTILPGISKRITCPVG